MTAEKKNTAGDSLRSLKGIGEKTEQAFARVGVTNIQELLQYYPREYDAYTQPVKAGEVSAGSKIAVSGQISGRPVVRTFGKNSITMIHIKDETGTLQINWFHMPYLRTVLKPGMFYVFRGTVIEKNGRKIMEQPEMFRPGSYDALVGQMLPIYGLTQGLTNNMVRKAVSQALERNTVMPEILPEELRQVYGLCEINYAVSGIHYPKNPEILATARKRLIFEEFFFFMLAITFLKESSHGIPNHYPMKMGWKTEDVIASLPYKLTKAQQTVWGEMEHDLASPHLMNRLIQGDVGSGKTILAFLAMVMAYDNGYQSAMMAPTEVLAEQHYQALQELLEQNRIDDVHPVLLRGSCTAKEKREIYAKIASGEARMIIGTHALIQEAVEYRELGLVITDEQHRFGVRQRESLERKGFPPNVLVMSATPIPRTLAMILYGDLDISLIREMPSDRLPIKNCVVGTSYRETAYKFMEKQIASGRQVYIICPMVEPNEELTCENVTEYTEKMKKRFGTDIRVEALHGQMKAAKKQDIMHRFSAGEIDVLVSTTVVEVGVNVPNATVMMIENAERFGLAQLHQLRGRVGRGHHQSYCIFMHGGEQQSASGRLEILNKSNDGFYIAEEDLKLRGPGDILGVRQSGIALFQIADIFRDHDILMLANEAVKGVLALDPHLELPQNFELKRALEAYIARQNDDRSDS